MTLKANHFPQARLEIKVLRLPTLESPKSSQTVQTLAALQVKRLKTIPRPTDLLETGSEWRNVASPKPLIVLFLSTTLIVPRELAWRELPRVIIALRAIDIPIPVRHDNPISISLLNSPIRVTSRRSVPNLLRNRLPLWKKLHSLKHNRPPAVRSSASSQTRRSIQT
jgi:hypothetical protein